MKANEAPKRIYCESDGLGNIVKVHNIKWPDEEAANIEYTRTDAFIKKACDAYCEICDTKECEGCAECCWVIKFRRQLLKY